MEDELRNELLDRALSDILQLSEMRSVVVRHLPIETDENGVQQATLGVIADLVESGAAIVGDVVRDTEGLLCIRSWELPPTAAVQRIEREWRALGTPNLGDVCWLELTESGRSEAHRLARGAWPSGSPGSGDIPEHSPRPRPGPPGTSRTSVRAAVSRDPPGSRPGARSGSARARR
jgi:hypothetical protein